MTGELLVTPEQLEQTAADFQGTMTQVMSIVSSMTDQVNSLSSKWQGEASTAYKAKFDSLSDDIQKFQNMINEHVRDLQDMANVYRNAEQANEDIAASLKSDVLV